MMPSMTDPVRLSVILASDRTGRDVDRCLESLAAQRGAPKFEVIVASAQPPATREGLLVGWVRHPERNPAARRNRAAEFSAGEVLAFLDDDAAASPDWLARGYEQAASCELFGGRDLPPRGAPLAERVSDLLLATPIVGSGIPAHERNPRPGPVSHASAIALCNLFVSRDLFDALHGFDEGIGYVGEDTDFVSRAMKRGIRPVLVPDLVVFHRRRRFPLEFLAQRWRYRFKTGRLLGDRASGCPRGRVIAFLAAGVFAAVAGALWGARALLAGSTAYAGLVWALSAPLWRRDPILFPVVPFAFALHHLNYWLATVGGGLSGALRAVARKPSGRAFGRREAGGADLRGPVK